MLAPVELQPFLERPYLKASELLSGDDGLTLEELNSFQLDGPLPSASVELTPVSRAWPMGFGWSSCVAQSFMVSCVLEAGFSRLQLLTEEGCLLPDTAQSMSIATDDVLHFLRATPAEVEQLASLPLEALHKV